MSEQLLPNTRARMVEAAARLLRREGYAATGWRAVVEEAQAPWGSAHHHFPGGKQQLASEAVRLGGEEVTAALRAALKDSDTVADAVGAWFALAARNLQDSDYQQGCPVATVALETVPTLPTLTDACSAALREWEATLADAFEQAGAPGKRSCELATIVVANLEGALLLARVERSTKPLRLVGDVVGRLVEAEVRGEPHDLVVAES